MGLDVYLYKLTQPAEKIAADDKELEDFSEKTWHFGGRKYESLSDAEKEEARAKVDAFAQAMGFKDSSSGHPGEQAVEEAKSAKWPDHICTLTYLRSSYNGSGLNSCLKRYGLPDLHGIFDVGRDDYRVLPDWRASRERAAKTLSDYIALSDGLDVCEVSGGFDGGIQGKEAEVLKVAREVLNREPRPFGGGAFSNSQGLFCPEGMNVVAVLKGTAGFFGTGVYYVTKRDITPENDWTRQALEIVVEMCDEVLSKPDPNTYCFHWSG